MANLTKKPIFLASPLTAAITLCFLASSGSLYADDTQKMDTLVVTAAGYEQKLTDAPSSISVITREDLSKRPYTSLLDAVRDLEGVDVGETRDKAGQGSISIRGMGSDYTLVLINGRRQNNHGDIYPNDFGGSQFNHIPPLDAIERIEVIRGPASTLYGADALGGVINIITKKEMDKWSGSLTVGRTLQSKRNLGDDHTWDVSLMGPVIPGTLNLALRGSIYDKEASAPDYAPLVINGTSYERELGFGSGGKTVDNTNKAGGFSLYYTPTTEQTITLDFNASQQVYDNKEGQLGTLDSIERLPRTGYKDEQEFTRQELALSHQGRWENFSSLVSLAKISTENKGRTLPLTAAERTEFESATTDANKAKFLPRPDRKMESSQYTLDAKLDIPLGDHLLITGAQVIQGELEDGVFGMYGDQLKSGEVQKQEMWSVFVEDNWMLTEALTVTGGLRYDDHKTFGEQTSPRLYGVYAFDDSWTVKGGVSTGYKTPKTTDLFQGITGFGGQGTSPIVGTPDLKPETSISSEIALYWQHPVERHGFNITVFQNKFKDKIQSQGNLPSCESAAPGETCADIGTGWASAGAGYTSFTKKINIDEAVMQGVELAGRYQIMQDLALRANYTYTDSEQKSGDQKGYPLSGTAEHMANASLEWKAMDKLLLSLIVEARSDRFRGFNRFNQVDSGKSNELYYKDYEVLHLGASYKLRDNITLNGRVNNLLDKDFTSYTAELDDDSNPVYYDDYNNKDKARNFWLSLNVTF